jgi:aryl-alcohol dehydrogenase-like predicted oxidoreductase
MNKRKLGRTDLLIAPLVLGGNVFGWTADARASHAVLDRFVAGGGNAVDTADVYSRWAPGHQGGESEIVIGDWMRARGNRDQIVVITKVGSEMGQGKKGLKAGYILEACEASLKRLGVETIDLYLSHWPDGTPHDETLEAYAKLKAAGKIRWCGASNYTADMLSSAEAAAKAKDVPRYEVLQPEYNLYDRAKFDGALRDYCVANDVGVITYFSLAKGFLTGKYRSEEDLTKSPRGGGVKGYLNERGFRMLATLETIAASHNAKLGEVALAWVMQARGVTAPIASATTPEQVDSLVAAMRLALAPEDVRVLDAL